MNTESDGSLDWGASEELTPFETLMWRADVDPSMRSTVLAIEILDVEPDWARMVAAHDWASRLVPRFRDRIIEPLGVLGTPVWSRDGALDLHYHLRRTRLGGDADHGELLAMAAQLAMTPFDRARPPWEAVLVEGLPGGRAAYLLKLHHALTDGLGLTQLLSQLHSRQRAHTPDKPQPRVDDVVEQARMGHLSRQLRHDLGSIGGALRSGGAAVVKGLSAPVSSAMESAQYISSARRVLAPPASSGLPLLARRGTSWRFVAIDVEFAGLRSAAKAAGGSLNDAFLAALLAGFRLYHQALGVDLEEGVTMPVTAPVSIRRDGDAAGGNRFAPARLAGPVGMTDPADRIVEVGRLMRSARSEPGLESADLVAPLLARVPSSILVRFAGSTTAGNDLQASNVPGVREDMYLAGAKIERIYPFAPLPGCAAMIALHTYAGVCCVGANLDAAAITDTELFGRCLRDGFAEVLELTTGWIQPTVLE